MPIKYKVPKADSATIPAAILPFYVERDGFMFIDAEGAVETETLVEFRDNNRELMRLVGAKTIAEAKTKLERLAKIDPDEVERIRTELDQFVSGKAPKLDELVTARTETMKKDFEKKVKDAGEALTALQARLSKVLIDDNLTTVAATKGVLPGAIEDIRLRGNRVFKLENDEVHAYGPDGKSLLYGKDSKPLTIAEWMDQQATAAPHLFSPNKGGGGNGGGGNNAGGFNGPNPFSKKTHNLTKQAEIIQKDPELAKRLQASAEL